MQFRGNPSRGYKIMWSNQRFASFPGVRGLIIVWRGSATLVVQVLGKVKNFAGSTTGLNPFLRACYLIPRRTWITGFPFLEKRFFRLFTVLRWGFRAPLRFLEVLHPSSAPSDNFSLCSNSVYTSGNSCIVREIKDFPLFKGRNTSLFFCALPAR